VEDGKNFTVKVYEKDYTTENDLLDTFTGESKEGKLELSWTVKYVEDKDDEGAEEEQEEKGYTKPEYVFVIESKELEIKEESPVLEFKDWLEIELIDEETGDPIKEKEYILKLADGKERKGKTDKDGYFFEDNIPPGKYELIIDGLELIDIENKGKQRRSNDT
jgi:hypothetical protein